MTLVRRFSVVVAILVGFLRDALGSSELRPGEKLEPSLRELLYLVLSTPEYQLG